MSNEWEHILSELGEGLLEEESGTEHIFSEKYTGQKKVHLRDMGRIQKKISWVKAAAVILMFCCIVPVTVVAAVSVRKYVVSHKKQGNYGHEYVIDKTEDDSESKEVKHVKVVAEFPAEYEETQHLKWETEDGKQLSASLLFVTAGGGNISLDNVLYTENIDVDGTRGVYHEYQTSSVQENAFDKMAVVFYEELGYVVEIYGTENIGRAEFMDLMKQVHLEETTLQEADEPGNVLTSEEYHSDVPNMEKKTETVKTIFDEKFLLIDDNGPTGEKAAAEVCVTDMCIVESVNELSDGTFRTRFLENVPVDKDGVIRYQAQIIKKGDGINSLDEIIGEKTIERVLLVVTVELENKTDKDAQYWLGGGTIQLTAAGETAQEDISLRHMIQYLEFTDPVWSSGTETRTIPVGEKQAAFTDCVAVKSGEKVEIQVAFAVCREELQENMYVEIGEHLVEITGY